MKGPRVTQRRFIETSVASLATIALCRPILAKLFITTNSRKLIRINNSMLSSKLRKSNVERGDNNDRTKIR